MLVIKNYVIDEEKIHALIEENKKKPEKKKSGFRQRLDSAMKQAQTQQETQKKGKKKQLTSQSVDKIKNPEVRTSGFFLNICFDLKQHYSKKQYNENNLFKAYQKDYPLRLKLQIVQSIEQGNLSTTQVTKKYGIQSRKTVVNWLRKYGTFHWENQTPSNMPKIPEQEVRLLKKQKAFLEKQAKQSDKKAILFDMMIDLAKKEYNIPIRKNSKPE